MHARSTRSAYLEASLLLATSPIAADAGNSSVRPIPSSVEKTFGQVQYFHSSTSEE